MERERSQHHVCDEIFRGKTEAQGPRRQDQCQNHGRRPQQKRQVSSEEKNSWTMSECQFCLGQELTYRAQQRIVRRAALDVTALTIALVSRDLEDSCAASTAETAVACLDASQVCSTARASCTRRASTQSNAPARYDISRLAPWGLRRPARCWCVQGINSACLNNNVPMIIDYHKCVRIA